MLLDLLIPHCQSPMIAICWNKSNQKFRWFQISDNPYERKIKRLIKRMKQNVKQFNFFATLTFAKSRDGYYPIKERFLERKIKRWNKLHSNFYPYKNKKTLSEIVSKTSYIRQFINKLQVYCRKYYNSHFTYFWRYELGGKTERPHFHMVYSNQIFRHTITKYHWEMFEKRWGSGYVDIEPITSKKKAVNYLEKYFTKEGLNLPYGSRSWSCSRDIPKMAKSTDWVLLMICPNDDLVSSMWHTTHLMYDDNIEQFVTN